MNITTSRVSQSEPIASFDRFSITPRAFDVVDVPFSVIVTRPEDEPDLWESFLTGAHASYSKYGVERVLEVDDVRTNGSTTLVLAIVDRDDQVVGGVRAQGPYQHASEAHALTEWDGRPGTEALRGQIESRIPAGVVEMKTGWVSEEVNERHTLAMAIARTPLHVMRLLDIRYALCTVADHAVRRWRATGAETSRSVPPVAYPDDRYRTVPIWWDRATALDRMDPGHVVPLLDEQLRLGPPYRRAEISLSAA